MASAFEKQVLAKLDKLEEGYEWIETWLNGYKAYVQREQRETDIMEAVITDLRDGNPIGTTKPAFEKDGPKWL